MTSLSSPSRPTAAQVVVVGWAVALLLARPPVFAYPRWTPVFALAVAGLPVGSWLLIELVRRRDPASVAAAAFVGWAALSALTSAAPWISAKGGVERNSSVLTLVIPVVFWAIGRALGDVALTRLLSTVVVAAMVQLPVAVAQLVWAPTTGTFATIPGRATGLMVNPVYFGALLAGVGAAAVWHAVRPHSRPWWAAAVAGAGFGTTLSGSRVALAALLGAAVIILMRHRAAGGRRTAGIVGLVAGGVIAGWALSSTVGGRDAVDRATGGGEGIAARLHVWWLGIRSLADGPLLGTGPGLFRVAVDRRLTPELVAEYSGNGQTWADPHNIVILVLATTGIVGALLLAVAATLVLWRARGPLAWLSVGIATTWLLEPTVLVLSPLAALAIGGAMPRLAPVVRRALPGRRRDVLVYAGVLLAAAICLVDVVHRPGIITEDAGRMETTSRLFLGDPLVLEGVVYAHLATQPTEEDLDAAARTARRAIDLEPVNVRWWLALADVYAASGATDQERAALDRATEISPTSAAAWLRLVRLGLRTGDEALEQSAGERLCAVLPECRQP